MSDRPVESMSSSKISMSSTFQPCTVFCDAMDFPFDPNSFYRRMKSILGCRGEVLSIRVYVYKDQWPDITFPGITIVPIKGDKEHCMLVDIALWAMENPATYYEPLGLVVISKNIKQGTYFLKALESLEDRYYNVLLALPQHLSSTKLHTVTFQWLYTSLQLQDRVGTLQAPKHKPKSRDETVGFSNGLPSLYKQAFNLSQIVVFWDAKGCPTKFSSIRTVLKGKGYHPDCVLIRCYLDMCYKIPTEETDFENIDEDRGRYMIDSIIRFSTQEGELAKVTRMLLDIVFWAMNNDDQPQNLMFISKHSKDTMCDRVMRALEDRGFNVIFEPSSDVKSIRQETIGTFESLCKSPRDGLELRLRELRVDEGLGRKITDRSLYFAYKQVVVFWVVEGCPSNPRAILSMVRSTLASKGYGSVVSMTAFVVREKFSKEMMLAYHHAGMFVRPLPFADERGIIPWLLMDFLRWSWILGSANHVVISKPFQDDIFEDALEYPQLSENNVLFEIPDYMFTYGSYIWSAQELCFETAMSGCPVKPNPSRSEIMSYRPDEYMPSAFHSCTIFWDVMDYPFPEDLDPDLVYSVMKSTLKDLGCRGEVSIRAYVDKDKWPDDKEVDGVYIIPIEGDDYTRGLCMVLDIIYWASDHQMTYPRPLGLMVISEQIKKQSIFFPMCHRLTSSEYHVLLTLDPSEDISRRDDDFLFTSDDDPPNLIHNVPFHLLLRRLLGSDDKRKSGDETAQLKF